MTIMTSLRVAAGLASLLPLLLPLRAAAQCGGVVSQCRDCHETRGERPVLEAGSRSPWHRDHAFGDFCPQCHGGDADATDAEHAHAGLMSPMADVAGSCGKCHDPASVEHAYSSPPPTAGHNGAAASGRRPPTTSLPWRNAALATTVVLLGASATSYVLRNERQLRARPGAKEPAP